MAFYEDSRHIDELTADLAKRNHLHAELAAKELADCEAARTSELGALCDNFDR